MAAEAYGPILEVACGTGRITLPLAQAGFEITAIDLSEGMLSVAKAKAQALPLACQQRIEWLCQDMAALSLDRSFAFAFVPFRSFQHLLSIADQRKTLSALRAHLAPGGRLALHLFDPRLDLLLKGGTAIPQSISLDEVTGRRFLAEVLRTDFDYMAQVRRDLWRYAEIDENGDTLREDIREMALRWTHRWELYHLLALMGFTVEAEYSDFKGTSPSYGNELIVVCKAN
ncbi:MAG: class I SAM-dependent methyltransferase [Pseudomonadota bacterium]